MTVKKVVARQYRNIVDTAGKAVAQVAMPPEGWLRTVRKALHLSGQQLANKLGVTRAQVLKTEVAEASGSVTIKTLQHMAAAMNCRFVYAIVPYPEQTVDDLIRAQAKKKAMALIRNTNVHMALEDQLLTPSQIDFEVERLVQQMLDHMPSDFWNDIK